MLALALDAMKSKEKPIKKELVGASTAVLILSVLKRGSSYGYDIVRQVNEEADGAFTWQEGTVYPVLHKLERQGLVRCRWQEAFTGRKRKYYILTPAGREALEADTRQWELFHQMIIRLSGVQHA
jgi:DNA-binding PadR family transcriptional regulator